MTSECKLVWALYYTLYTSVHIIIILALILHLGCAVAFALEPRVCEMWLNFHCLQSKQFTSKSKPYFYNKIKLFTKCVLLLPWYTVASRATLPPAFTQFYKYIDLQIKNRRRSLPSEVTKLGHWNIHLFRTVAMPNV